MAFVLWIRVNPRCQPREQTTYTLSLICSKFNSGSVESRQITVFSKKSLAERELNVMICVKVLQMTVFDQLWFGNLWFPVCSRSACRCVTMCDLNEWAAICSSNPSFLQMISDCAPPHRGQNAIYNRMYCFVHLQRHKSISCFVKSSRPEVQSRQGKVPVELLHHDQYDVQFSQRGSVLKFTRFDGQCWSHRQRAHRCWRSINKHDSQWAKLSHWARALCISSESLRKTLNEWLIFLYLLVNEFLMKLVTHPCWEHYLDFIKTLFCTNIPSRSKRNWKMIFMV